MKIFYFLVLVVFSLVVLAEARSDSTNSQLRDVKKIYVAELGTTDSSDIIREKLKIRLMQTGKFTVVERESEADAIFTGTVVMDDRGDRGPHYSEASLKGVAVFYLRRKSNEVIWSYEYKPKFFDMAVFSDKTVRAYNQVAERTIERLMKDAGYKK